MSVFSVVILICSAQLSHGDCQMDTAIDVMRGPRTQSAMMCMLAGQTLVGQTALAPREGLEYMKIMCTGEDRNLRSAARMINSDD